MAKEIPRDKPDRDLEWVPSENNCYFRPHSRHTFILKYYSERFVNIVEIKKQQQYFSTQCSPIFEKALLLY